MSSGDVKLAPDFLWAHKSTADMRSLYVFVCMSICVYEFIHGRSYETIRILLNFEDRRPHPTLSTKSCFKAHSFRLSDTCYPKVHSCKCESMLSVSVYTPTAASTSSLRPHFKTLRAAADAAGVSPSNTSACGLKLLAYEA